MADGTLPPSGEALVLTRDELRREVRSVLHDVLFGSAKTGGAADDLDRTLARMSDELDAMGRRTERVVADARAHLAEQPEK